MRSYLQHERFSHFYLHWPLFTEYWHVPRAATVIGSHRQRQVHRNAFETGSAVPVGGRENIVAEGVERVGVPVHPPWRLRGAPAGHPAQRGHRGVRQRVALDDRVAGRERVVHYNSPSLRQRREHSVASHHSLPDDSGRSHHASRPSRQEYVSDLHVGREDLPPAVSGGEQQQVRRSCCDRHTVLRGHLHEVPRRIGIAIDEVYHLEFIIINIS